MKTPYDTQPDSAKWSRSVSRNWVPENVLNDNIVLLRTTDQIVSLGSCFAANLVPYLKRQGFQYVEMESRPNGFSHAQAENFSYGKFSAAYGNIYTSRQFRQLIDRAYGKFWPEEDRWHIGSHVVDPFRPGLRYRARSDAEFDALTTYHLSRVRMAFEAANVVIFTLGLTEAWVSKSDGAVFPACPGTVAGMFDPSKHEFVNFSVSDIVEDLDYICARLRELRPDVRIILTVSPVPLAATATTEHVLVASTYSKAVLRVACSETSRRHRCITYFPSYELITGPQAPHDFFEDDRRNASGNGIDAVMAAFLAHCECRSDLNSLGCEGHIQQEDQGTALSNLVSLVECEEAAADTNVTRL